MPALSPRARELLERARSADRVSASARQRMSEQLQRRLGSDVPSLPDIDASMVALPKASPWLKLLSLVSTKGAWAGLSVLCAGVALGGVMLSLPSAPRASMHAAPQPVQNAPASAALSGEAEPSPAASASQPAPPAVGPRQAVARSPAHPRRRASDAKPASPKPSAPAAVVQPAEPPPTAAVTLDAEFALLQRANAALSAGRAAQALALLEQHAARFPHAELAQARDVAFMLALCQAGRTQEARARAQRFSTEHPQSPFVGRMRQGCDVPVK